jgi:hypothetical protein
MRSRSVRIDELRLRVPGLSPTDARRLGEAVAQRLGENPPQGGPARIPELAVRVRSSKSDSVEQLADTIASRIRVR